ncbi:MAG: signal peptidase I, partial [Synechococcaceae bacterium WB6_3A_227]|nr:signal peptidase I [Synechococcaceae bacterium WB6_3A_227]
MRSSFAPSVHTKHCFGLEKPQQEGGFWRSLLLPLALILLTRHFLLEARYIPSGSMLPGLQLQDRLMVDKLSTRQRSPRRGEIIVFNAPQAFDPALKDSYRPGPLQCFFVNLPVIGSLAGLQAPACDAYIKRVVAIAGDQVVVDPSGKIQINGKKVFEPYVSNYCSSSPCRPLQTVVP